jgi:uncharacterized protein with PQ loop repeat
MTFIGWLGSFLLAVCAIPEAIRSIKTKRCHVNKTFLGLWAGGEVLTLWYAIHLGETPLIFNYVVNLLCISIILYYRSEK